MEYSHLKRIRKEYGSINLAKIECLEIDDVYEYMDKDLVEMLEVGVEGFV